MSKFSLSWTMRSTISSSVSSVGTFPRETSMSRPRLSRSGASSMSHAGMDFCASCASVSTPYRSPADPPPVTVTTSERARIRYPCPPSPPRRSSIRRPRSLVCACVSIARPTPVRRAMASRRAHAARKSSSSVRVSTMGTEGRNRNTPSRRRNFRGVGRSAGDDPIRELY